MKKNILIKSKVVWLIKIKLYKQMIHHIKIKLKFYMNNYLKIKQLIVVEELYWWLIWQIKNLN